MKARSAPDARLAALAAVSRVLDEGRFLGDAAAMDEAADHRDAAFARRLAYGVLRWYGALDFLASGLLERPLRQRDADIHRLVLLGLYQLWKEDTPPHAAVHATAECARALDKTWAVKLVNAVLRNFQRRRDTLLVDLESVDARFSHPEWLLDALRRDWPDAWEGMVRANNASPPLWVRVNRRRSTRDRAAADFHAAGFTTVTHPHAPEALRVDPPAPVATLPGFAEGRVSVQDAAAQLATGLLAPRTGNRVLDACAAPGGKACHLLEQVDGLDLVALDRDPRRAADISDNLRRLGLHADVVTGDATDPDAWWDGRVFDRILLDAPCSATGVIRRHPEIKWLRTPAQVVEATKLQARLLDRLWPLLGAGGILVYATCSVLRRENSEQIHAFLESHPDAECLRPEPFPGRTVAHGRQILPGDEDMDGFFHAILRKPV